MQGNCARDLVRFLAVLRPAFPLALEGNQLEPQGRASPQFANPLCVSLLEEEHESTQGTIITL